MMKLPPVKVVKPRIPRRDFTPRLPKFNGREEEEVLSGQVQGLDASDIEERFARGLTKNRVDFIFRETFGGPRGVTGSVEVDFLVLRGGLYYAVEIDTAFTHRKKGRSDILHDAKLLSELEQAGYQRYPQVFHVQGDEDLTNQEDADKMVRVMFQ